MHNGKGFYNVISKKTNVDVAILSVLYWYKLRSKQVVIA